MDAKRICKNFEIKTLGEYHDLNFQLMFSKNVFRNL